METTTVPDAQIGFGSFLFLILILALMVIPYWKIWRRTGHSGWWGLLLLVPLANLNSLWVLAFKDWLALRRR